MKNVYPSFMCDSSTGDSNKEAIMDFVISWMLRLSQEQYQDSNFIIHCYCKRLMSLFLKLEFNDIEILEVSTVKQWKNADIITLVKLSNKGLKETHAIFIEDKVYGKLNNPLENYKKVLDQYLEENGVSNSINHYVVLTMLEENQDKKRIEEMINIANHCGFEVIDCDMMVSVMTEGKSKDNFVPLTGNYLFDSFWGYSWNDLENFF